MRYYAGQALPGGETRSAELAGNALASLLGTELAPGTFNVSLIDAVDLGPPDMETTHYRLWRCSVATESMVSQETQALDGWVLKMAGEAQPSNFLEIISPIMLRSALKMENWPAFPVEIGLHWGEGA